MTDQERQDWRERISKMGHVQLASLWRFAVPGHSVFTDRELTSLFDERFNGFGGMTTLVSKEIGW